MKHEALMKNKKVIEKIVINVGVGRLSQQPNFEDKVLPELMKEMALIAGQKPAITKAKKSISGFKVREGQTVGLKVTLRYQRMSDFLERLIKIVFPRLRDFRGIDLKNIDSNGNLTVGLREQTVFPEINPEISKVDFGLEISIVSNAKNKEEAVALYRSLGIPLKK
ncbi:50S ribosomal protein L5 [Candidatus Wolfebacteria bacterium CG18_big_fil_WC_8_21_14_2_50_39_7]|uniref:Large ribosomal subunit protein uL5 n=5 Tax=Candidatus Wolfeibacteriota TaxID=1752735 RepID=A0A2M7Q7R7_9BACT|nr:50S ribosomal protein L5 [Parcubacteria group bacterium]NCO89412.1 50S ribosomal protein L5 [Candidatus Wolfebacteria bacterium]OIO65484.1 MAG: 50S ribosomal protein L5 [Candidatus Wolfebacteria bacterium CG1_02_39_135]PIP91963.1 MAG: 50S ribosomal protein L5 [Candidatus Wolfebacteria bacterium CG18_big_fil_WC_8_21_14_2_50_39_7]PIU98738.1 MAG: 50S ribosomal protein L5 [Candidatus Wolfebacteria bacterium CG03_land_8_20_14_0_80_39_317]PIY59014.1 MAG: 50S ribosomal protein L5 [Candidatus Wolfe